MRYRGFMKGMEAAKIMLDKQNFREFKVQLRKALGLNEANRTGLCLHINGGLETKAEEALKVEKVFRAYGINGNIWDNDRWIVMFYHNDPGRIELVNVLTEKVESFTTMSSLINHLRERGMDDVTINDCVTI